MTRVGRMTGLMALACAMIAGPAVAQDAAPIIQPGAPGEASRTLTVEQSVELARGRYTPADVRFMQHMIVHHGQAVDMGALVEGRTTHDGITAIARRIAMSQETEIDMMRAWLAQREKPLEADDLHAHHGQHGRHAGMAMSRDMPLMPGMLSPAQMDALAASADSDFDRLYLSGMIHHHQGAIDMVHDLMSNPGAGEDPEISEFLAAIIADQSAEILRMQVMLGGVRSQTETGQ